MFDFKSPRNEAKYKNIFILLICYDFTFAGPRATALNVDECPLHIKHPPTGEEFALGCGVCRNSHTF